MFKRLLLALPFVLTACDDAENRSMVQEESANEHILNTQIQALEKAKGVEQVLQDGMNERRQIIDE
jgi:hypothetical protein